MFFSRLLRMGHGHAPKTFVYKMVSSCGSSVDGAGRQRLKAEERQRAAMRSSPLSRASSSQGLAYGQRAWKMQSTKHVAEGGGRCSPELRTASSADRPRSRRATRRCCRCGAAAARRCADACSGSVVLHPGTVLPPPTAPCVDSLVHHRETPPNAPSLPHHHPSPQGPNDGIFSTAIPGAMVAGGLGAILYSGYSLMFKPSEI